MRPGLQVPYSNESAAKKETQEPSKPKPNPTSQRKGNLCIKTVTLPKRIKLRSFKCPTCDHRARSEKERNQHHKTVHGELKCAVCEDTFDTPSGLHRHKYKHTNLNFICETCGDKFSFSSQLKDHRIKHLTSKGHTCFAKNCGKSFKNNSSLVRHLQTHSGKTFKCPKQGCDYSTKAERNLKSHLILHTDTHNYSCENCGQAFKYHTQMSLQQKRKLRNHQNQNQILPANERVTYASKLLHYQKGLNYVVLNVPPVIIELGVKRNETNITKQFMVN